MRVLVILALALWIGSPAFGEDRLYTVGLARIDVTPEHPIRLSGYAARRTESEGVEQRIWVKALAIGSTEPTRVPAAAEPQIADGESRMGMAVLLAVDSIGVPSAVTERVAARLAEKAGIARERFVVCSSHSHTTPCLAGSIPNMFGAPIPEREEAVIERYTWELAQRMEEAALAAIADRRPAKLAWAQGKVGFAANRRTAGGPVDHSLPLLRITDGDGNLRGVVVNYACHCTTLVHNLNKVCGDWAGYAQEMIEEKHAGATALVTIGCGADANPHPRGTLELAKEHGSAVAAEVERLLSGDFVPLAAPLSARFKRIELPFDALPTREAFERLAAQPTAAGNNARIQLARLERDKALAASLPYSVQAWRFGDDLAMVFLPGEVVVDYAVRLKKELGPRSGERLWVTAYANDVAAYIPSRRILAEGGYEAEGAMVYYGHPARLAPAVEDLIVETVHGLVE